MISSSRGFVLDLWRSRSLIMDLSKRDYRQQNQGSYLGMVWNYLQPILFIAVLYSIFTFGFKSGADVGNIPFSIYLVSGMICWQYFSSNLTAITGVIKSYSFLVKKIDFRLSTLPIVKLISSLLPHIVLSLLAVALAFYQGIAPGFHTLQLIYYYLCMVLLLLGLGWLTASTSVFVKDVSNVVSVVTQFGLWLTPIFWHIDKMPEKIQWILKINPMYYVVTGYRDAITGGIYFWQRPLSETIIFWATAMFFIIVGAVAFRRLKPHFAEVV
jgi:ABC-type polysaccharide/polyol phosphate export permease